MECNDKKIVNKSKELQNKLKKPKAKMLQQKKNY